ncbi:MAG: hypothetical protein IPH93_01680 [Saprospiraceae bacterium]|nr:hypothetical protein [Saprospiraceae bacterium]
MEGRFKSVKFKVLQFLMQYLSTLKIQINPHFQMSKLIHQLIAQIRIYNAIGVTGSAESEPKAESITLQA